VSGGAVTDLATAAPAGVRCLLLPSDGVLRTAVLRRVNPDGTAIVELDDGWYAADSVTEVIVGCHGAVREQELGEARRVAAVLTLSDRRVLMLLDDPLTVSELMDRLDSDDRVTVQAIVDGHVAAGRVVQVDGRRKWVPAYRLTARGRLCLLSVGG
jgi:hypothetical protein